MSEDDRAIGGLIQIPVQVDRDLGVPIQDQLANGIRQLILEGTLRPGMRLPATRALSHQMKISRNTAKNAYLNLVSQGYLQSRGTAGTFVCTRVPDSEISALADGSASSASDSIDEGNLSSEYFIPQYSPNLAGDFDFSISNNNPNIVVERTWRRLLLQHLPYRPRHANSMESGGLRLLREAISHSISPLRGMSFNPDASFIVCDDYRALDMVIGALVRTGDKVGIENPCDAGLAILLKRAGVELIPMAIDSNGPIVRSLPRNQLRMIFVTPSHQIPLGVTMTPQRRKALLDWAEKSDAYIVEWDTFGEFCYDGAPIPSLFSLDKNNRVIYINCISSWIGAGVNLGYLVVPDQFVEDVQEHLRIFNPTTPWLDQRVTADFILSNSFFGHLRRVRQALKIRRDTLAERLSPHLRGGTLSGLPAGRHLVWQLPNDFLTATEMKAEAASRLISLSTLKDPDFWMTGTDDLTVDPERIVLLSFAGLMEEQIALGIKLLSEIWTQGL